MYYTGDSYMQQPYSGDLWLIMILHIELKHQKSSAVIYEWLIAFFRVL